MNVAESVFGVDEVVARIDVAVKLHNSGVAAIARERAHSGLHADPVGKRTFKQLHVVFTHIVAYPFVENRAEKCAPLVGGYRCFGQRAVGGHAGRQRKGVAASCYALDDGRKLDVSAADVFEKTVEFERSVDVVVVDHSERIPVDVVAVEQTYGIDNFVEGGASLSIASVSVVLVFRSVDRDSDEEVVALEKFAPFVVEKSAVGLQAVCYCVAFAVDLLEMNSPLVERQRAHHSLASVPGKLHVGRCLRFDVLTYETFQYGVAHHVARRLRLV